ncbi:MAG TPA: iron ABC transporter [Cytophagales bacterium]|nr:iron ABC transporter [Cytophagales bacterium]
MSTTTLTLPKTARKVSPLIWVSVLLLVLIFISLGIGAVPISPREALQIVVHQLGWSGTIDATQEIVLLNIRLPRLLLTIIVGSALGLSGAVLQGLFRNPLVEPGIIGVSSGAALGTMMVIMLLGALVGEAGSQWSFWIRPLFAFGGGLIATMGTLKLSQFEGRTQVTYLLLAGIAINALAQALIGLSIFFADDNQLRTYTFWTLGDISGATWDKLYFLLPLVILCMVGLLGMNRSLNAISLGEAEAFHSGVPVERVKRLAVLLSALIVGTSVAFVGIIGFVGLVVPHIIRIVFTADHTVVLPASALGGASLLLISDMLARTIVSPAELPIGVVTATIGTPLFIYLIMNAKRKGLL